MKRSLIDRNLKLLGVDIHFEQGVTEDMCEATGVEVAVGSAVVLLVVDLRELEAAVLQQLVIVKFLVSHVNLEEVKIQLSVHCLHFNQTYLPS